MVIFKHFWPAITWALIVLVLTGLPGHYFPEVPTFWDLLEPDKIVHIFIFGVFTLLLAIGLNRRYGSVRPALAIAIQAMGTSMLYGGLTELLQGYVFIGRTASVYDFIANCIGSIAGYLFFKLVYLKHFEKKVFLPPQERL